MFALPREGILPNGPEQTAMAAVANELPTARSRTDKSRRKPEGGQRAKERGTSQNSEGKIMNKKTIEEEEEAATSFLLNYLALNNFEDARRFLEAIEKRMEGFN